MDKNNFKVSIEIFDNSAIKCQCCNALGTQYKLNKTLGNINYPMFICKDCLNVFKKAFCDLNNKNRKNIDNNLNN